MRTKTEIREIFVQWDDAVQLDAWLLRIHRINSDTSDKPSCFLAVDDSERLQRQQVVHLLRFDPLINTRVSWR